MSQGKFRLTKQVRNNEVITKKVVEVKEKKPNIKYISDDKELDVSRCIDTYNKEVQINKRYKNFKNAKVKNERKKLLSKNDNRINTRTDIHKYNNRYINDIPFSINIQYDENKMKMYNLIEAAIDEQDMTKNYSSIIDEIFTSIITDDLFNYTSSTNNKRLVTEVTPNKFIALMMEQKKQYQSNLLISPKTQDYLRLYISKHICNRIKQELRKATKASKGNSQTEKQRFKNYSKLVEYVPSIGKERLINYMYNKHKMNKIDYEKNSRISKKIESSIQLEISRQEEKLENKFVPIVSHANINLTHDKIKDNRGNSFDVFGSGDPFKSNENSEYNNQVIAEIRKLWLANTNIDSKTIELKDAKIKEKFKDIVELRSYIVHKKKKLGKRDENDGISYDIIKGDQKAYRFAILEKYLSNNVFNYYSYEEVEEIIINSVNLSKEIIEKNYLPRFYKVFKEFTSKQNIILDYSDLNIVATKFLLNQIYNNQFKSYMMSCNVDLAIWTETIKSYSKKSNHMICKTESLELDGKSHQSAYRYISQKISDGNYEEYMRIWKQYVSSMFISYIKLNHKVVNVETFGSEREELEVNIKFLKEKIGYVSTGIKCRRDENICNTIYLLAKLCNRKEVNELENAFRAYYQFITQSDIKTYLKENNEKCLFGPEEVRKFIEHLKMAREVIGRNVEVLVDNQSKTMTEESETVLKLLIENFQPENLSIYNDEENLIQFKHLRFIEQQNSVKLLNSIMDGIVKQSYLSSYNNNKQKIVDLQRDINNRLSKQKEKIKTRPRHSTYKYKVSFNDTEKKQFITDWNQRNKVNFEINTVELYTVRKLHDFTLEIHGLFLRTMKAIERDFILLNSDSTSNGKRKYGTDYWNSQFNDSFVKNVYAATNIEEGLKSAEKIKLIRNKVAHFTYYNDKNNSYSLFEIYKNLYELLAYNNKRRKAFRSSLENIFAKSGMNFKFKQGSCEIYSQKHQYANKENSSEDEIWNELELLTREEVTLFEKVFTNKNC